MTSDPQRRIPSRRIPSRRIPSRRIPLRDTHLLPEIIPANVREGLTRRQTLAGLAASAAVVAGCAIGLDRLTGMRDWLGRSSRVATPALTQAPRATPQSAMVSVAFPLGYFHGCFTVNTPDDVAQAASLGVNFTICYGQTSEEAATPTTDLGRAMLIHGMKTFVNVESRYLKCVDGKGTVDEQGIRELVGRVRNSPLVAGYWTKDDDCGDEADAVRRIHDIVRSVDPNPRHLIMPGFSLASLVKRNYVHGQADVLGFYPYPSSASGNQEGQLVEMLRLVRERTPAGAPPPPFIGIYQAFGDPPKRAVPTRAEILDQARIYLTHGAIAIAGYGWRSGEMPVVIGNQSGLRDSVTAVSESLSQRVAQEL